MERQRARGPSRRKRQPIAGISCFAIGDGALRHQVDPGWGGCVTRSLCDARLGSKAVDQFCHRIGNKADHNSGEFSLAFAGSLNSKSKRRFLPFKLVLKDPIATIPSLKVRRCFRVDNQLATAGHRIAEALIPATIQRFDCLGRDRRLGCGRRQRRQRSNRAKWRVSKSARDGALRNRENLLAGSS